MSTPSHPIDILSQQFDTNDLAFTKIDEEVAKLQNQIRELHAFRNTFSPTYNFPPEILSRIFSFLRRNLFESDRCDRATLKWIVVSHVSQHWRDIALATPSLWSHITNWKHIGLAEEWVQRSKAAPLSVELLKVTSPELEQVVSMSLGRIRELALELTAASWETLSQSLSSPAPLLEYFSITIPDIVTVPPTIAISDALFAGTTPRLSRLEVSGCSVHLHSSIFANLTVLELRNLIRVQQLSALQVLSLLNKLPHLSKLSLLYILHPLAPLLPSTLIVIHLPYLKALDIRGNSVLQDQNLLAHLSFRPRTNFFLDSTTLMSTSDSLPVLGEVFKIHKAARQPEPGPAVPIFRVLLSCFGKSFRLLFTPIDRSDEASYIFGFNIRGNWEVAPKLSDAAKVTAAFANLPLRSIESFTTDCEISIEVWMKAFGSLPNLKHITLSDGNTRELLEAIIGDFKAAAYGSANQSRRAGGKGRGRERGRAGGSNHARSRGRARQNAHISVASSSTSGTQSNEEIWTPIFPGLEQLDVGVVDFPELKNDLVDAFRARKLAGKGLKVLTFGECRNVDQEVVDEMRNVVDEVEWVAWTGQ